MDLDYDQHDCLLSPEWTVACGQVYYKDKNGNVCPHGLLAVTSVRSYIRIKSYPSKVIQLWCADSGNLLFDLKSNISKMNMLDLQAMKFKYAGLICEHLPSGAWISCRKDSWLLDAVMGPLRFVFNKDDDQMVNNDLNS
ncbi:hypothetical protein Smp_114340 [Schistosoma mansoni]|uniref:hypothetical protein n=1 Tax=Schistosoma mansoni TaxID=6183 RepID=UPI00019B37BC|nr:hypothetical protein Smp_114340 [Schistosoma mansoni]|eukprot:XP_018652148.1 hypothetical protein Smp_114340 [Schistosoma mansoni]